MQSITVTDTNLTTDSDFITLMEIFAFVSFMFYYKKSLKPGVK